MKTVQLLSCALMIVVSTTCAAQSVTVASGEGEAKPRQPQLAISQNGQVFVTYGRGNGIFICRSSDRGQSFTSQSKVGELPKLALGMRRGPRIAMAGESVVVAAISHETGDLVAWHSSDHGNSWSNGVVVNSVPKSAREGLHGMASGLDGSVYLVWLDLRSGSTEVYLSKSSDAGASWQENVRVYRSPSGTVCECCHPTVAVGPKGRVHVMWRNFVDGDRDMYLASSQDGTEFRLATKLGSGRWPLKACPMDGGDLAVNRNGGVESVWRRENTIYANSPNDKFEKAIGDGEQPCIESSTKGSWTLWLSRRNGDLLCIGPDGPLDHPLSKKASDPVIRCGGDREIVVAAWEEQAPGGGSIVVQALYE